MSSVVAKVNPSPTPYDEREENVSSSDQREKTMAGATKTAYIMPTCDPTEAVKVTRVTCDAAVLFGRSTAIFWQYCKNIRTCLDTFTRQNVGYR
jgi:hypothetical protein